MAIVQRSTLVTCPSDNKMNKYVISALPKTVNTDMLVVDSRAKEYYNKILNDYNNVINSFKEVSNLYKSAKVNTADNAKNLKNAFQKVAVACENQANYCKNRKQELISAFEYATLEAKVNDLEQALNSIK